MANSENIINPKSRSLLSISKAAKILSLSPDTLRNWEKEGKLIPLRTKGKARRYSLFELKQLKKDLNLKAKPKKGLISISKAARVLNISSDTLRNWDEQGLITIQRSKGGARRFTKAEINRIKSEFDFGLKKRTPPNLIPEQKQVILTPVNPYLKILRFTPVFILLIFSLLIYSLTLSSINNIIPTSPQPSTNKTTNQKINTQPLDEIKKQLFNFTSSLEGLQKNVYDLQASSPTNPANNSQIYSSRLNSKDSFIGQTIIDSNGVVYPSARTTDNHQVTIPSLGTWDHRFAGVYLNRFDVTSGGDLTVHGKSNLGETSFDTVNIIGNLGTDIIPASKSQLSLGSGSYFFKQAFISTINGGVFNATNLNSTSLTLGTSDLGSSSGPVIALANLTTTPNAISNQGFLYLSAGALKYQGSSTLTTIAAADYSEDMPYLGNLEAGDIVSISSTPNYTSTNEYDKFYVEKSPKSYDPKILGIVSSFYDPKTQNQQTLPIALVGRVPVKVSNENGSIQQGDLLTSSSIPGVAMKAKSPGQVLGKALESFSGESGKILVFVNVGFGDPENLLSNLSLTPDGSLLIPKITSTQIQISPQIQFANQLENSDSTLDSSNLVAAGSLATNSENTQTNYIEVASKLEQIDNSLNSYSQSLTTINNKLADQSNQISQNNEKINLIDQNVASNSAQLDLQNDLISSNSSQIAQINQDVSNLKLTPPEILLATSSANLAELSVGNTTSTLNLSASDATIAANLHSLGNTFLAKTNLAGDLTQDGTLSLTDGKSINGLPTLYIQNSSLAESLDLFNGAVIVDKSGQIKAQTILVAEYKVIANRTSGQGTLAANKKSVDIENKLVNKTSRILITPTTQTNKVLAVTDKVEGEKFTVSASSTSDSDINFDWWFVNEIP
ncbi:MerR family DNA-binding transcriptional regulator [Candidatus Daviesbacteria bacterium]|nr:MerR family DNA-binding transcriptional regulator [Candidatus Daviesbacteria bacterium]